MLPEPQLLQLARSTCRMLLVGSEHSLESLAPVPTPWNNLVRRSVGGWRVVAIAETLKLTGEPLPLLASLQGEGIVSRSSTAQFVELVPPILKSLKIFNLPQHIVTRHALHRLAPRRVRRRRCCLQTIAARERHRRHESGSPPSEHVSLSNCGARFIWKIVIWKSGIYFSRPSEAAGQMPKTIFTGANQAVVDVMRRARVDAGLTQAQLAARIDRDQSHVSLIEGSQRRLDLVEFHAIAVALGLDPVELFREIVRSLPAP